MRADFVSNLIFIHGFYIIKPSLGLTQFKKEPTAFKNNDWQIFNEMLGRDCQVLNNCPVTVIDCAALITNELTPFDLIMVQINHISIDVNQ